jgi:hypothetical protein
LYPSAGPAAYKKGARPVEHFFYQCVEWAPRPKGRTPGGDYNPGEIHFFRKDEVEYPDRFKELGPPSCEGIGSRQDLLEKADRLLKWLGGPEAPSVESRDQYRMAIDERLQSLKTASEGFGLGFPEGFGPRATLNRLTAALRKQG